MSTKQQFLSLLTGSFSMGAADNPTVAIIEAAYRHHGIDARYINCEVLPDDLAAAVAGARAMGWRGFNCSIPHKNAVIAHIDGLAPSAAIIGAVNCVVHRDGRLIGENTDGKGFLSTLAAVVDPKGRSLVLLGAGGAAKAIAVEAALAGVSRMAIVNRDAQRGTALAKTINDKTACRADYLEWRPGIALPSADIVVNATSVGLAPHGDIAPDIDLDSLQAGTLVADVIPNPPRTRFLAEAEKRGCRTLNGLGMLVAQAVISIGLWTGRDVEPAVMKTELERIFAAG